MVPLPATVARRARVSRRRATGDGRRETATTGRLAAGDNTITKITSTIHRNSVCPGVYRITIYGAVNESAGAGGGA